ncbi:MAG: hypothetical protein MK171_11230 [Pirellulales bacterium]|nr:hypothetical protein [Pirellulales bacterium]
MNTLLENPWPIYVSGAALATLCGFVVFARRTARSLLVLVGVVVLVLVMIVVERVVVTDSEEVQAATTALMAAIGRNDMSGVLASINPTASQVRSDVESLMPLVRVSGTGAGSIQVQVDASVVPPVAVSSFRGKVDGIRISSGERIFYFDQIAVTWANKDGRWLLTDYMPMHRGRPISVVESVRGNRPVSR